MAEKILFVSPRNSDAAVVTATNQVGTLPATNVQDPEPSRVWRTTVPLTEAVDFVFSTAKVIDTAACSWPEESFSADARWRLRGYTSAGDIPAVLPAVDSDWVSMWPSSGKHASPEWGYETALIRIVNANPYRYWRVLFDDPSSTTGYINISRVAIDKAIQFKINPRHEGGISFVPLDIQEPNGYGQIFTMARPYAQRRFELTWGALGKQNIEQDAMELARLHGQAGDFFVFLTPDATDNFHIRSMQAMFEGQHRFTPTPNYVPDKDGLNRLGWGFSFALIQKL